MFIIKELLPIWKIESLRVEFRAPWGDGWL
jgi:hypothetical protein